MISLVAKRTSCSSGLYNVHNILEMVGAGIGVVKPLHCFYFDIENSRICLLSLI